MTIDRLKKDQLLLLECISGSRAYGLATAQSDTDIKGVYVLDQSDFYGLEYTPQVANPTNDIVYYELKRFFELLSVNNPHLLELLATPNDKVLFKHPLMEGLKPEMFLSKLCSNTFGKYAFTQIRKAKGLNKKIVSPMSKERKGVLDFCYVYEEKQSEPLKTYLKSKDLNQEDCGLQKLDHLPAMYALYHALDLGYAGIIKSENADEVCLSSIPREEKPLTLLYFNKDAYSTYCKEYKAYWQWVEKRNENRYVNTVKHGKNYDAKNMMHTFRLLDMAIEIGEGGELVVERPNREFLLKIKSGAFAYEDLLKMAEEKRLKMTKAFEKSKLPDRPDSKMIDQQLRALRVDLYQQ